VRAGGGTSLLGLKRTQSRGKSANRSPRGESRDGGALRPGTIGISGRKKVSEQNKECIACCKIVSYDLGFRTTWN
jgi:hypothetical protein